VIKNVYENGNVLFEVRVHDGGFVDYWLQVGQAGLMLDDQDILDLNELLTAVSTELLGE
jgi:hypothetical protein